MSKLIRYNGFMIDVFDTGNKKTWCFQVFKSGLLLAESCDFAIEIDALAAAKNFCNWLAIDPKRLR